MSSIIDNASDNTLLRNLQLMSNGGRVLHIATAFFSLDALMLLADSAAHYDRIRILFGSDASPEQRRRLLALMRSACRLSIVEVATEPLTLIHRVYCKRPYSRVSRL
ncbi:MAG: hypothetical protein ACLQVD_05550 [Capsulimonadaceae bacterium]